MPKEEIRDLKDGDWYWIDKAIIQKYAPRIGASGIAVYNALASFANSKTQSCFPTQKALADMLGLSRRTVARKIKSLRQSALIEVIKKNRGNVYYLLSPQVTSVTEGCDRNDTSYMTSGNTNKNKRTRINNNDIDEINSLKSDFAFKGRKPQTREELLALDLAIALHDIKGLPFYLSLTKKYPESMLRKTLSEVKELPIERIKKSRGALFNYLIQRYAQKASHNLRD
ncbi:MAG: helix-turn-helix domain-containing protein [Patescibacteria group bacterium]